MKEKKAIGRRMIEPREGGFSYKARLTLLMKRRDDNYMWTVAVSDNPNDMDWAAWTVITHLAKITPTRYPEEDEYFGVDGVVT